MEPTFLHFPLEIGIGCSEHPDIHPSTRAPPHRLDLAIFEHPEQGSLDLGWDGPHLVEKEHSAIGPSEVALAIGLGIAIGPRADTEELGSGQGGGDGSGIDRHEGIARASARAVECPRHQLLAGPRLAPHQDRPRSRGMPLDGLADRHHGRAFTDQAKTRRAMGHRLIQMQQQDDPPGQEQNDPPLEPRCLEHEPTPEGLAIDLHLSRVELPDQHEPAIGISLDTHGAAAQPLVGQRAGHPHRDRDERG